MQLNSVTAYSVFSLSIPWVEVAFLSFLFLGLSINSLHCLINISYNLSSANLVRAKQYPETESFFPLIIYLLANLWIF